MKKEKVFNFEWPDTSRELTLRERIAQARPQEQIEILIPYVHTFRIEKVGEYDLITAAHALNNNSERFDSIISELISRIELAQVEAELVPLAEKAIQITEQRVKGGKNSHGIEEEERKKRNKNIQDEINRLCLKHSYSAAQKIVASKYNLHPDTIRSITTNPRK